MEIAAERVDPLHIPGNERRPLGLRKVEASQRRFGVGVEARSKGRVLLQPIEQAVDLVSAHASLHSTAARLIRPSSPKYRTSARAGVTAPSSTIQFRNSCSPVLCNSLVVSDSSGSCSPASSQCSSF